MKKSVSVRKKTNYKCGECNKIIKIDLLHKYSGRCDGCEAIWCAECLPNKKYNKCGICEDFIHIDCDETCTNYCEYCEKNICDSCRAPVHFGGRGNECDDCWPCNSVKCLAAHAYDCGVFYDCHDDINKIFDYYKDKIVKIKTKNKKLQEKLKAKNKEIKRGKSKT